MKLAHEINDNDDIMLGILGCVLDKDKQKIQDIVPSLKNLLKCKCVSPDWNRRVNLCLESIEPVLNQVQILVKRVSQSHVYYPDNTQFLYTCSPFLKASVAASDLIDCCNGLLLLNVLRTDEVKRTTRNMLARNAVVCNPITKQHSNDIPYNSQFMEFGGNVALAFDPSVSPYFQIVSFHCLKLKDCPPQLKIFSSKPWKWKSLKIEYNSMCWPYAGLDRKSVYFNGAIYKLSGNFMLKFLIDGAEKIDVGDRVREMRLPIEVHPGISYCYGVSNGWFCYAAVDRGKRLGVWKLSGNIGDPQCHWMLCYNIICNDVDCKNIGEDVILDTFHPCAFHPYTEAIFLGCNRVNSEPPFIYLYDLKNRTLETHNKKFSPLRTPTEEFYQYAFYPFSYCLKYSLKRKRSYRIRRSNRKQIKES